MLDIIGPAWLRFALGRKRAMWLDRPPVNTDAEMLGIHGLENFWQVRATFGLAAILNLAVLAALLYAVARKETDFSNFIYVYFGILFGSILIDALLTPFLYAGSVFVLISLNVFLLVRFCDLPLFKAVLVCLLFEAYQIAYILAYRLVDAKLTSTASL